MLPRHVAMIMDGNGRWAEGKGLERIEGHRRGADSVREVVRAAREIGIECLTLYAFSAQNWQRPVEEVAALMQLLRDYVEGERSEIMDHDIRFRTIGDTNRLPAFVREPLDTLVTDSAKNPAMQLVLALSYGGRESIVEAVRAALRAGIGCDELDEEQFGALLPTRDLPPLDLLIRTSGEKRISNFLLWESAYTEFHFTETMWPDFRRTEFVTIVESFGKRERRFGLTSTQVRER